MCPTSSYGEFIGSFEVAKYPAFTAAVHLQEEPSPAAFSIDSDGIYCVEALIFPETSRGVTEYKAWLRVDSRMGQLPAIQVNRLAFLAWGAMLTVIGSLAYTIHGFARRKGDPVPQRFLGLSWLIAAQAIMSWLFLDYTNRHGYDDTCEALRRTAILFVGARDGAACYALYSTFAAKASPLLRLCSRALCVTIIVLGMARETELLRGRDETRDSPLLMATLCVGATLVLLHCLVLAILSQVLKRAERQGQLAKAYRRHWRACLGVVLMTLAFCFIDGSLLLSWRLSDEYGHDMLSLVWKARWVLIDEWQTIICWFDVFWVLRSFDVVTKSEASEKHGFARLEDA